MTFSILAYDPIAGQLGVASQSHYPGVGAVVTWAEAGVGAVATQAFADPSYGPRALALMRAGMDAGQVLTHLLGADAGRETRQVGILDVAGNVATHTGRLCVPALSEAHAPYALAIGNTLDSDTIAAAMVHGYETTDGDLTHRLLAALQSGQTAGGDIRGMQSAALRVVRTEPTQDPWDGVIRDLRVDDHSYPIAELGRLADLYDVFDAISEVVFAPQGVVLGAREVHSAHSYVAAAERLVRADHLLGANPEAAFWAAVVHARAGRSDLARRLLDSATRRNRRLPELFRRLVDTGILTEADVDASIRH
ncbi:DUF1028 domain-containing protein [Nocardia sp. NPDC059691]|uniref:DUF1028 domain-containing protein n=1 Tax=Nocardia sp. NPDC059691 TaxID=3346908 RepID=UPI00368F862A